MVKQDKISNKDWRGLSKDFWSSLVELLVPIVCVFVAAALILLVIKPGIHSIRERREVKADKEVELQRYQEKNQALGLLASRIVQLNESLNLALAALPDEEQIPELMAQVQEMVSGVGVEMTSLQYSGSSKSKSKDEEEKIRDVHLQLRIDGEYPQIEALFGNVEKASRLVVIDRFDLSTQAEASMSANLSLSSFYLPPPDKAEIGYPITLDLASPEFQGMMARLKTLQVYEVRVEKGVVGKENPFTE